MTNRINAVHKLAKKMVDKYELQPPVDVFQIFNDLGIMVTEESNQYGIEAYSVLEDTLKICINPELTYYGPRKRFTLAHELGHIIIPWHNGDIKGIPEDHYIRIQGKRLLDTQELEANIFASDILMLVEWIKNIVDSNYNMSFEELVKYVSNEAKTSIMASFYALEYALPSGYVYLVKKNISEWWMLFSSKSSYTINWFSYSEDRINFFSSLCVNKEEFGIGNYEVIVFRMISCPNKKEILQMYEELNKNIQALIMKITDNKGVRILPFLDIVLSTISKENYISFIYQNKVLIKSIYSEKSPLIKFYKLLQYEDILRITKEFDFEYKIIDLGNDLIIIYILEKYFKPPIIEYSDPNDMLKKICNELWYEKENLYSINGIMSSANSMFKKASLDELYNWCKYRLITDPNCEEFVAHPDFERYLVNKCKKMIWMRRQ